jgi:ABC-type transport system involved in multi-copper enzyme maturation permease subunit
VRRLGQGGPMIPLPSKWRTFLRLSAPGERTRAPREVWKSPIAWREANARGNRFGGILARWGFIVLGIGAAIVLVVKFHNGTLPKFASALGARATDDGPAFRMALLALLLLEFAVITIVALYMSAGCVSKEREDGTLDLLLTTPVTQHQYVWGKLRGLVSFLSALIAVPVGTMAIACIYALFAGKRAEVMYYSVSTSGTGGSGYPGPLIYPEMMVILPLVLVPFVALCVTVGMTWSIKAKGVLGAVIPSVAIIGGLALVLGFCGMNAVQNVPVIGAVINAFSPVTNMIVLVNPIENVNNFLRSPDNSSAAGRMSLFIGALIAAAGYGVIVYAYIGATVKSFDQVVRKLSGTAS